MNDQAALKAAAEAANGEQWIVSCNTVPEWFVQVKREGEQAYDVACICDSNGFGKAEATFIAAANPSAILSMLSDRAALAEEVKHWQLSTAQACTSLADIYDHLDLEDHEVEGASPIIAVFKGQDQYIKKLEGEVAARAERVKVLEQALKFYADGEHFTLHDGSAWDTVSGEPMNFYEDESNTATVEDGSVAKLVLAGEKVQFEVAATPAQTPTSAELLTDEGILQMFATCIGNERDDARQAYVSTDEIIDFVRCWIMPAITPPAQTAAAEVRNAALEEAAQMCEAQEGLSSELYSIAKGCAMAIRVISSTATISSAPAQVAAKKAGGLSANEARYMWLRERATLQTAIAPCVLMVDDELRPQGDNYGTLFGKALDAAIDAAMSKDPIAIRPTAAKAGGPQCEIALKVVNGDICYRSDEDDQSYGMWCPVTPSYVPPHPEGAKFYLAKPEDRTAAVMAGNLSERHLTGNDGAGA